MDSLGIVESRSIAAGAELTDMMVKGADVELVKAATICSGRFLIQVSGDVKAVEIAVQIAKDSGRALVGSFVLSNVSDQVINALKRGAAVQKNDALAIVECKTASSGIAACDCSVKRSQVSLARLVIGQGINGKSYFVISGDVASVKEASDAAKSVLGKNLVEVVVLPFPSLLVVNALTKGLR
ncbi:MAG: BMC domain-containing protein [Thermodesulfobacteriota bacterium]|nr:BMC domain-containing protein [Thermodesulfobacteriota bacterium]